MKYEDEIITITIVRGDIATSIGERGLMVKDWRRLKRAFERVLTTDSPNRSDGHSGVSAIGELLLDLALDQTGETFCGLTSKPDKGPNECWPCGKPWFNGK